MVHLRLNTKESNPNEFINFIIPLPDATQAGTESARELLRALAAQVKPVMKTHGFKINSFEEYEHNNVFAGRNWNNGETVELVLRRPEGSFLPMGWLMSTLCHEMAHIKHMNHGPEFQRLWSQLRVEVQFLQSQGYYGDGFWSSGTRLADLAEIGGRTAEIGDLPEYMCGGAHSKARPSRRRRRTTTTGGPSNNTGRQTAKRRKAGSRVTAKDAFIGGGRALNDDIDDENAKKTGSGKGKRVNSKKARDERANAIEKRLAMLQSKAGPSNLPIVKTEIDTLEIDSDTDNDSDVEIVPETDSERKKTMDGAFDQNELDSMRSTGLDFDWANDFVMPPSGGNGGGETWTAAADAAASSSKSGSTLDLTEPTAIPTRETKPLPRSSLLNAKSETARSLQLGRIVEDEVEFRRKESVGLAGSKASRRLGGSSSTSSSSPSHRLTTRPDRTLGGGIKIPPETRRGSAATVWECNVCTLKNEVDHLACAACATPRGETNWRSE